MANHSERRKQTNLQPKKKGRIAKWLEEHINEINALNMVATFVLSVIVAIATISITKTQRDIEYQEARPSFNVNAEYVETKRKESKDSDYGEPLAGINEITKVTVSNDGAMLYRPKFRVYPFFQVKRMCNAGIVPLPFEEDYFDSVEEYKEAIKHNQYYFETFYRPVLLNVAIQNLDLYRIIITGTKKGELCSIVDSEITKKIIALFDRIKPIYTIYGNSNGLFWVFQNGEYVEKDRAMMYISLEYFLEIEYSTTLNKSKVEKEVYHVVTGHDAYVGSSDFGERVKVELLTSQDEFYKYYSEMQIVFDSGVAFATEYPVGDNVEDFITWYELDLDDFLYSVTLEMANREIDE